MLDANKDFDDRNLADNEEVIAQAINYLKHHDPANANREYAATMLKRMQRDAKPFAAASKLNLEDFVDQYNQSQKKD